MIVFKRSIQKFEVNSFVTDKLTTSNQTLFNFGYIESFDCMTDSYNVIWVKDFHLSKVKIRFRDMQKFYRSIYPYYNSVRLRGNIWKYSYRVLLDKLGCDGFQKLKVDKLVYKKSPKINDKVLVTDAVYVLKNNIRSLDGEIKAKNGRLYTISLPQGTFEMKRSSFKLIPQDEFQLISVRCY